MYNDEIKQTRMLQILLRISTSSPRLLFIPFNQPLKKIFISKLFFMCYNKLQLQFFILHPITISIMTV